MLARFYRDPLIRRFVSGSAFAAAFVYVAVRYFKVETEVVWVFLLFSIVFVIGMMMVGFVLSFVIRLLRRPVKGSLLDHLEETGATKKVTGEDE
ncbi:MAG: hypothetical protein ACFHX7_02960 [Pseudomonadota bacterium]